MLGTNHIPQTGGSQDTPEYFLLLPPKTPLKLVFTAEVTELPPLLAQQKARDCLRQIEAALKDIPGLNFKTSWGGRRDTQDAIQDQSGVKESSIPDPR